MTAKKHLKHWAFTTIRDAELGDFKDIPGTGGAYRISKDGVVISNRRRCLPDGYWIVLKHNKSSNAKPFNRVTLYFDGAARPSICQVSRLILEAWVGPPPAATRVAAHKNGQSDDDRLDNLMWAENSDVKHGQICRGTWAHGERAARARLSREQVEAARKIVIEHGVPANLLATALGIPQPRVREWLTKTWDAGKWADLVNPLTAAEEPADGA